VLSYLSPEGAHLGGRLIGETTICVLDNLMTILAQVAIDKFPYFNVYGNDYNTPDGSGGRGYIHVQGLVVGHVASLLQRGKNFKVNLRNVIAYSLLEVIRPFKPASGRLVPYKAVHLSQGKVSRCFADPSLTQRLLGSQVTCIINEICADAWRWQIINPDGSSDA